MACHRRPPSAGCKSAIAAESSAASGVQIDEGWKQFSPDSPHPSCHEETQHICQREQKIMMNIETKGRSALTPGPSLPLGGFQLQPSQQLRWQDPPFQPAPCLCNTSSTTFKPTLQSNVGCPALPQFSQTMSGMMFLPSGHSHVLWVVAAQF